MRTSSPIRTILLRNEFCKEIVCFVPVMSIAFVGFMVLFCTCSVVSGIVTRNVLLCLIPSPDQTVRSSRGVKTKTRILGRKINIANCVGVFAAGYGREIYPDRSHESESNYPGNCTISEQRDGYRCETEGERNEMKGRKD